MTTKDLDRIRFVTSHFNELQGLRYMVPFGLIQLVAGLTEGLAGFPKRLPLLWLPFTLAVLVAFFLIFRSPSYYRSFGQVERQPVIPSPQWAPLSVFSPAGAVPQLEIHRQPVSLRALRLLIPIGLALALLLSLRAGSRIMLLTDSSAQDPWLRFNPPVVLVMDPAPTGELIDLSSPLPIEMMYALFGSLFLLLWLLRGSRLSQGYLLAFAIPLLGLATLGVSLGFGGPSGPSVRMLSQLSRLSLLALAYLWIAQILCGGAMLVAGLLDHWQLVRVLGRPGVEASS
jgi:hypothetical protein